MKESGKRANWKSCSGGPTKSPPPCLTWRRTRSVPGTAPQRVDIKGRGKHQLQLGDLVVVGNTTLRVESSRRHGTANQTKYLEEGTLIPPDTAEGEEPVAIAKDVSASLLTAVPAESVGEEAARRLRVICDIPLQLTGKTRRESRGRGPDLAIPCDQASTAHIAKRDSRHVRR